MKTTHTAALVVALVGFSGVARADDATPRAMAEALFDEGRTLLEAGKIEPACAKFAASEKLDPASGTLLNLGDCYEKLGRTATAWITFRDAEVEAHRTADERREAAASTRALALEPRLSRVVIQAPPNVDTVVVKLDDVALPPGSLGQRVPVDPGTHHVHVDASGYESWEGTLDVPARASVRTLAIPALAKITARVRSHFWSAPRATSVVFGSLGVASLGVGIGFGIVASSKWNEAKTVSSAAIAHDAGTFADVSTATFIAGGVLLTAAVIFWIASPSQHAPELALRF